MPPVTAALLAINIAIFIYERVSTGASLFGSSGGEWTKAGALFAPAVIDGEYWRLFTYMFFHGSLLHIAMNMLAFWQLGPITEQLFGSKRFALLYAASGVMAGGVSLFWKVIVPGDFQIPSLGASGAIFGVMGMILAIIWVRSRSRGEFLEHPQVRQTGFNLILLFILSMSLPIDHYAHFGGLFSGAALAALFSSKGFGRITPEKKQTAILILVVAGLMTAYGVYPYGTESLSLVKKDSVVSEIFNRGVDAFNRGDFEEAERAFLDATKKDPLNVGAMYNAMLSQQRGGKLKEALETAKTLESLLDSHPGLEGSITLREVREYRKALEAALPPAP